MKNLLIAIASSAMLLLAACGGKPAKTKTDSTVTRTDSTSTAVTIAPFDSLTYQYKSYQQKANNCGADTSTQNCTTYSVKYPVFDNHPELNKLILPAETDSIARTSDNPDTVIKRSADEFIKQYYADTADAKIDDRKIAYESYANYKVIKQFPGLLTWQEDNYGYTGGAHGNESIVYKNWNTATKKLIKLDDIFNPGYKTQLTAVGEKIFRRDEKLKPNQSLADDYFFKDGKFSLNGNFLITARGLRFLYNEYEIKAYAAGQTELLIPYDQIKTLLKPNTVVSQFVQ